MRIAFVHPSHVYDWDETGLRFKPSAKLTPDETAGFAEMTKVQITLGKPDDDGNTIFKTTTKVNMHSKMQALDTTVHHLDLKPLVGDAGRSGRSYRPSH